VPPPPSPPSGRPPRPPRPPIIMPLPSIMEPLPPRPPRPSAFDSLFPLRKKSFIARSPSNKGLMNGINFSISGNVITACSFDRCGIDIDSGSAARKWRKLLILSAKFKLTHCPLPATQWTPQSLATKQQPPGTNLDRRSLPQAGALSSTKQRFQKGWTQTVWRGPDAQGLCSSRHFLTTASVFSMCFSAWESE
jgi:hypothetical protein